MSWYVGKLFGSIGPSAPHGALCLLRPHWKRRKVSTMWTPDPEKSMVFPTEEAAKFVCKTLLLMHGFKWLVLSEQQVLELLLTGPYASLA